MDPISDMLTSIRNAIAVLHPTVDIPFSNLKYEIAKILEKEKFIEKTEKKGKKTKRFIEITLKYFKKTPVEGPLRPRSEASETHPFGRPAISGLKRISKPGQRIYTPSKKIKRVKGSYGIAIISTSKGLMTDKEARKQKLGGEVICEVW
ncbi:MAG: 30S ribosomal protein S8 [Candidatus Nealsonbacteria bacterium CG23_combo_of_CG06-09_8_20_14_all_36_12]|uniref:Small ribosomal subunit protein uS8 n=2 Tax=Candidatus Nealsoniibacteriota TaxID=1817911 RepID=A0A2H0TL42_9BACT|nr:MAG: 30S ribosomal protein S8 [Candidatus Nealsonbacteria bacterium CG23_combo_of_CG06-09_8_20_14_all_36_12]PIR72874.1 MAG: 30S ribosomal protein S8 [Candidatus Nealsonbacteria bacterium CG10_big_fil_rev_8_21_14_0_10_36_23]